jgi:hypothetical protein
MPRSSSLVGGMLDVILDNLKYSALCLHVCIKTRLWIVYCNIFILKF